MYISRWPASSNSANSSETKAEQNTSARKRVTYQSENESEVGVTTPWGGCHRSVPFTNDERHIDVWREVPYQHIQMTHSIRVSILAQHVVVVWYTFIELSYNELIGINGCQKTLDQLSRQTILVVSYINPSITT